MLTSSQAREALRTLVEYQHRIGRPLTFVLILVDSEASLIHAWKRDEPEFETETPALVLRPAQPELLMPWEESGYVRRVKNPYSPLWGPCFELTEKALTE